MTSSEDLERRVASLESRMEAVATDAAAARHLAAARDRDMSDLTVKVDANRATINALADQTNERFERLEQKIDSGFARSDAKFEQVDKNFAEVRSKLDQTSAGVAQIVGLLDTVIANQDGNKD